jgi:hypothetical protein
MTSTSIKNEEAMLRQALDAVQKQFPNWTISYELNTTATDLTEVIKHVIKEVAAKFTGYKFSVSKNSYPNTLVLLTIIPADKSETFAYYEDDDTGYVISNDDYYAILDEFENHADIMLLDISVEGFIERERKMQVEFYVK